MSSNFRPPTNTRITSIPVRDNSTDKIGTIDILTTGIINIYAGPYATNFGGTGTCGIRGTCVTYMTN
jgi:hypothetical protein